MENKNICIFLRKGCKERGFLWSLLCVCGVATISVATNLVLIDTTHASSYTLSLNSSGAQSIDVSSSGDGTAISSDAVNVATTCRYGYNFTVSTSVDDNNLYLDGDESNNSEDEYFTPADGTTILKNANNAWGFYFNNASNVAPTGSSVFSAVPTLGNAVTIKSSLVNPSGTDINDSFNIYYGVKTNDEMNTGTYKMKPDTNNSNNDGTIVYTATIADACMQYNVRFNPTSTSTGASLSGTGTMSDQTVYEGVATPLTSNGFTAPNGYYFAGWNTAQDGTGTAYMNGQSVTDLTAVGSTINLYAMWTDCPGGYICYSANGNDVVGEMGDQSVSSSATKTTLYASNFSRDNYGFAGWNTKADGTGTNLGPNEDIEFMAGQYNTGGLRLYAHWIASAGNLQNWTCPNDVSMPIDTVTALTDQRDNQTYAVAKLKDGKCWMIENLRLEAEYTRSAADIALAQGYGGVFIGLADPETSNFTSSNAANSLYSTDGSTAVTITNDSWYVFPRYNNSNISNRQNSKNYSNTGNVYAYGNYYTWHAAVADTTSLNAGDHNTTSICPSGWRLPIGGQTTADKSFGALDVALGGSIGDDLSSSSTETVKALRVYPNNFLFSGQFYISSFYYRGNTGYYWSSTLERNSKAYYLSFSSNTLNFDSDYVYKGRSIRCLVDS